MHGERALVQYIRRVLDNIQYIPASMTVQCVARGKYCQEELFVFFEVFCVLRVNQVKTNYSIRINVQCLNPDQPMESVFFF